MNHRLRTFSLILCTLLLVFTAPALGQPQSGSGMSMDAANQGSPGMSANCPNPNCANCPKAQRQGMGMGQGMGHGGGGMGMMHGGKRGMHGGMGMKGGMMGMPGRQFYLNQAQELGLSTEQIQQLQSIRNDCKRNNIPLMAQIRVAKLDLQELLASENWSVEQAQKMVQQMTQLRAQMMTNHLQSLKKAQQVLTAEQRQRAAMGEVMTDTAEEDEN